MLLVAILFGFALSLIGEKCKPVVVFFDALTHAVFGIVNILMRLAPIGAFGAMAFTVGRYGIASLGPLAKLIAMFYVTCIFFVLVVMGVMPGFRDLTSSNSLITSKRRSSSCSPPVRRTRLCPR